MSQALLDYILDNILKFDNEIQKDIQNKIMDLFNYEDIFNLILNNIYNKDNNKNKYILYIILKTYLKKINKQFFTQDIYSLVNLIKYSYESKERLYIKGCNLVISSFITKEGFINCEKILEEIFKYSNNEDYLDSILENFNLILNEFLFNTENIKNIEACLESEMFKNLVFLILKNLENKNYNILINCIKSIIILFELGYSKLLDNMEEICQKLIKLFDLNNSEINNELIKLIYIITQQYNDKYNYIIEKILYEIFKIIETIEDENTIKDIGDIISNLIYEKKGIEVIEQNLENLSKFFIKNLIITSNYLETLIEENTNINNFENKSSQINILEEEKENSLQEDFSIREICTMSIEILLKEYTTKFIDLILKNMPSLLSNKNILYKEIGVTLIGILEDIIPFSLKNQYNDIINNLSQLFVNINDYSLIQNIKNYNIDLNQTLFSSVCYSLYVIFKNKEDIENSKKLFKLSLKELFNDKILIKNTLKLIVFRLINELKLNLKEEFIEISSISLQNIKDPKNIKTSLTLWEHLNNIDGIEENLILNINKNILKYLFDILNENQNNLPFYYDNIIMLFKKIFSKYNENYIEYGVHIFKLILNITLINVNTYENNLKLLINNLDEYQLFCKIKLNLDLLADLLDYNKNINNEDLNNLTNNFIVNLLKYKELILHSLLFLKKIYSNFNNVEFNLELIKYILDFLKFDDYNNFGVFACNKIEIEVSIIKILNVFILKNSNNVNNNFINLYIKKIEILFNKEKIKKSLGYNSSLSIIYLFYFNKDIVTLFLNNYFKKFTSIFYVNLKKFEKKLKKNKNLINNWFEVLFYFIKNVINENNINNYEFIFMYILFNKYVHLINEQFKGYFIEFDNYYKKINIDSYNKLLKILKKFVN